MDKDPDNFITDNSFQCWLKGNASRYELQNWKLRFRKRKRKRTRVGTRVNRQLDALCKVNQGEDNGISGD